MDTKRFFPVLLLALAVLFSSLSAKNVDSSFEEGVELRRISEYWKEKDYKTLKVQIHDFLSKHPKSSHLDQLYSMLGDLYFQEKNYAYAAAAYDKIQEKKFRRTSQFNHLHSLYEIGKYDVFILASDLFLKDPNAKAEEIDTIRFELAEIYFCRAFAPENEKRKKEWMKAALSEYQQLMQTKFGEMTLLPQAQIFAFLEEYQKAASLYLLLSHKDQSKKEEYLFHAASLQLHFDKVKAIDTFGSIYELCGKSASKAAFNQLNLLFQEKYYREYILIHDKAFKYIAQDKVPLMQYYLGKSLFHTHDYAKAIEPLSQCLASKTLDRAQEKNVLITLIAVAKETGNLTLFEKMLASLRAEFSYDDETANVLLLHSQLCRDKKEWSKARSDIQEILELNPRHPEREALFYDNALLLAQEEKWQEAASAFEEVIKEFPESAQRVTMIRQIVSCRMEDVRRASPSAEKVKKERLLVAIKSAVREKKSFSPEEKQKMRYLVGKVQFELGQYEEAIECFNEYVQDFSKDSTCADAYLLLAYAHQKVEPDDIYFILNAEKAIGLNPKLQGALDLHLLLFNTCLSLAEKAPRLKKAELIAKAADHLFLALDKPASIQNQRWLAGYYFQQYQTGDNTAIDRAVIVLEKLLGMEGNSSALTLEKEAEALKLAELYRKMDRSKERAQLLEALTKEQKTHSEFQWKYQRMAQFELGKAYLALAEREKAHKNFEELISSSSHISSYFALAATVEKAKLDFSSLKEKDRSEDSAAARAICNTLKNVQIKRKLHSEPLHLEAALCYVEIKSELVPKAERGKRALFLLGQMKENFSSLDDPLVQQYFSPAAQFPDKERLCRQYLTFVEIEMQRLRAEETHNAPLFQEASKKMDQLLAQATDETLIQRIHKTRILYDTPGRPKFL
jgi:TolA-binding protein